MLAEAELRHACSCETRTNELIESEHDNGSIHKVCAPRKVLLEAEAYHLYNVCVCVCVCVCLCVHIYIYTIHLCLYDLSSYSRTLTYRTLIISENLRAPDTRRSLTPDPSAQHPAPNPKTLNEV